MDELETCRNESCDNVLTDNDDVQCVDCEAYEREQMAYYGALFANSHPYSKEELEDCYKYDQHKLTTMLRDLEG